MLYLSLAAFTAWKSNQTDTQQQQKTEQGSLLFFFLSLDEMAWIQQVEKYYSSIKEVLFFHKYPKDPFKFSLSSALKISLLIVLTLHT